MLTRTLRFIRTNVQGLAALLIVFVLVWLHRPIVELLSPGDTGLLLGSSVGRVLRAVIIFEMGVFCAWVTVGLEFDSFDSLLDAGKIKELLERTIKESPPWVGLAWLLSPYYLHLLWFAVAVIVAFLF